MTLNIWKGYWFTELEEIKDVEAYFQKYIYMYYKLH